MLLPGAWNEQMPRRIPTLDSRIQNRNGPHPVPAGSIDRFSSWVVWFDRRIRSRGPLTRPVNILGSWLGGVGESSEPLSIWLAVLQTSVRPRSDATCSLLRVRSFVRSSCGAEARPEFMVAATERRRNNERTERSGNLRHSATLTHSVFSGSNKPFYRVQTAV